MSEEQIRLVRQRIDESIRAKQGLHEMAGAIAAAGAAMAQSLRDGGKILLCGNGGSASDAIHLAGEIVGRFLFDRPSAPAIALPANAATMTAIANDYGYDEVFARQVRGLGRPGDVLIGLSTSGRSPNVLAALDAAGAAGLTRIAMTGAGGGPMAARCEHLLAVSSDQTPRIQEAHILVGHILCEIAEAALFGND